MSAKLVGLGVLLLAAMLGAASLVFASHVTCRGGREGACAVDTYGVSVKVRHVDIPVREIVEISVDERAGRRGSSAMVAIVTRSMGRIELGHGQLMKSTVAIDDAVQVAGALRAVQARGAPDVDLWIGPPRGLVAIGALLVFVLGALLVSVARTIAREYTSLTS